MNENKFDFPTEVVDLPSKGLVYPEGHPLRKGNIEIKYEDHIITSKKLDFNIIDNNILIYDNVRYSKFDKKIETDNIKIDIITKNIEIFMNELNDNVKISSF